MHQHRLGVQLCSDGMDGQADIRRQLPQHLCVHHTATTIMRYDGICRDSVACTASHGDGSGTTVQSARAKKNVLG